MDSTPPPITVWMVSLRGAVVGTVLAAVYAVSVSVASLDVRQTVTEPANVRHRWFIAYVTAKTKEPNARRSASPWDQLSAAELQDQIAKVLRELETDLRGGKLSPHQAYATFEALGTLGGIAKPAVPTIIAVIDAWDKDSFFRIPYLCEAVKALGKIAPTSTEVIELLSKKLAGELPVRGSVCHRCGCILEALEQAGPAAREIAGPVLQRIMAEPGFMTTYDWQLGRAVKAIGVGGGSGLRTALERAGREDVLPGDRAAIFKALAKDAPGFSESELELFHSTAATALGSPVEEVRAAAAEALSAAGPRAVP